MIDLARRFDRDTDPVVRQELARLVSEQRTSVWNTQRARAAADRGVPSGLASLGKLAGSAITLRGVEVANRIAGAAGTLQHDDGPLTGLLAEATLSSAAARIGGGTDEIQKNVVAERILGLPHEDRPDAHVPFRDLAKNTTRPRGAP